MIVQSEKIQAKLIVANKVRGKAKNWFQAENTIGLSLNEIMDGFRKMYDHRPVRMALRKKFEAREWKPSESFADYFHDKIVLAKDVPVDEEEMVDYLIDGIPNDHLRNLARMKEFSKKEDMLRGLEKIPLRPTGKTNSRRDTQLPTKDETKSQIDSLKDGERREEKPTKSDEGKSRNPRCYNCNKIGHLAADCRLPKREKGSCFQCGEMGHLSKECPTKATASTKIAAVSEAENQVCSVSGHIEEEETFFRDVDYEISYPNIRQNFRLRTLMDTGSKVSFIKESFIPRKQVELSDKLHENYHGINNSPLRVIGYIRLNVTIDNETVNDLMVLVVPDTTMTSSIILGRDILKKFGLSLRKIENQAIDDVLNIEINDSPDIIADSLNINSEMPYKTQVSLQELFKSEYIEPVRPSNPKVDMELKLYLTYDKPFHFNPRRISAFEKEQLRKILDDLLERRIIQPSKSEFVSPIILVRKELV